ncbi:MAG: hypothetical protein O7A08_10695, partial [SAR324 cluster bacterium]|nr:hypothetical protein [SAR324 cluster bacterium]
GLQGFLAAQGLHGLQGFLAAQGLHGLQGFLAVTLVPAFASPPKKAGEDITRAVPTPQIIAKMSMNFAHRALANSFIRFSSRKLIGRSIRPPKPPSRWQEFYASIAVHRLFGAGCALAAFGFSSAFTAKAVFPGQTTQ